MRLNRGIELRFLVGLALIGRDISTSVALFLFVLDELWVLVFLERSGGSC